MKYVYTDGACKNNGKANATAGYGIFFGVNDSKNVSKKVINEKQTNNVAEMLAIIEVYDILKNEIENNDKITIVTDSEYCLKCLNSYGDKCSKKNWEVNIPNKDLVMKMYNIYKKLDNVKFLHVESHTGKNEIHSIGNDYADKLARSSISQNDNVREGEGVTRIYLSVPYICKNQIKSWGGQWDYKKKKWYILSNNEKKNQIISIYPRL
jgi:ribonuclease HI